MQASLLAPFCIARRVASVALRAACRLLRYSRPPRYFSSPWSRSVGLLVLALKLREARRAEFIRHCSFPKGLIEKLQARRSGLAARDGQLVARAPRQFFLAHLAASRQFVSMPSQLTDDLWHGSTPTRLPLLFAVDAKLGIGGGFRYVPDCKALRRRG